MSSDLNWARLAPALELGRAGQRKLRAVDPGHFIEDQALAKWREDVGVLGIDFTDEREVFAFVAGLDTMARFASRARKAGVYTNDADILGGALSTIIDLVEELRP